MRRTGKPTKEEKTLYPNILANFLALLNSTVLKIIPALTLTFQDTAKLKAELDTKIISGIEQFH